MLPFWTIFSRSCLDWTYDHLGTCYRKRQHQIWRYHHHGHVGYEQRHDRYPMIRLRFVHRHYQRQRMADGCSCSNQCGLGWQHLVWLGPIHDFKVVPKFICSLECVTKSYVYMVVKIEIVSLKTAGMLMVSPVAAPLAPYTDTTGRAAITIQVLFKSENIFGLVPCVTLQFVVVIQNFWSKWNMKRK